MKGAQSLKKDKKMAGVFVVVFIVCPSSLTPFEVLDIKSNAIFNP